MSVEWVAVHEPAALKWVRTREDARLSHADVSGRDRERETMVQFLGEVREKLAREAQ